MKILKSLVLIIFTLLATWVGLYIMFIGGIIQFIQAIRAEVLIAKEITYSVIKILFSGFVGYVIFCVGIYLSTLLHKEK